MRPASAIYREEEGDLEREIIWRERERREKVQEREGDGIRREKIWRERVCRERRENRERI